MNKRLQTITNTRALTEFTSRLTNKWNLGTLPSVAKGSGANKTAEDFLRDLVAMPTVTGNYDAIHDAFDYLEDYLDSLGIHIKRYEWNGVESMVASTRHTKTPTVCLFGHIDVVPATEELFQLQKKDGKFFGRGVLDMKVGIAAYLAAVQHLKNNLSDYNFSIMITSDEEVGGYDGAAKLAEIGYRPRMFVLPDGGANWDMELSAKGIWHATLECNGSSAHGSRPWEGDNAIDKLTAVIQEIRALFPKKMGSKTSTINLGILQGGEAINQIPSTATASIDMRFANMSDQIKIGQQVEAILEKHPDIAVVTEVKADPTKNDPEDTYLKLYKACTEEIIGRPIKWVSSNAGNDSRFFTPYDIPCANAYPAGGSHHGNGEYILEEVPAQLEAVITTFLEKATKIDSKTS